MLPWFDAACASSPPQLPIANERRKNLVLHWGIEKKFTRFLPPWATGWVSLVCVERLALLPTPTAAAASPSATPTPATSAHAQCCSAARSSVRSVTSTSGCDRLLGLYSVRAGPLASRGMSPSERERRILTEIREGQSWGLQDRN